MRDLKLQPKFVLQNKVLVQCFHTKRKVSAVRAISYKADFSHLDEDKRLIATEVKGVETQAFSLKKRLFIKSCFDKKEGFSHVSKYKIIYKNKEEVYFFDGDKE